MNIPYFYQVYEYWNCFLGEKLRSHAEHGNEFWIKASFDYERFRKAV
tara:strand:- start:18645 stop:18785 length:141 start_codon:yes stop_codon:yes gene_type:complete